MPTIDGTSKLAQVLQAQLARTSSVRKMDQKGGLSVSGVQKEKGTASSANLLADGTEVPPSVLTAIRALKPDDSESERRAFGLFLLAKLASTFGSGDSSDGSLVELAEDVLQRMQTDEALDVEIRAAGRQLLDFAKKT